jgi:xylan 1,4-beta-xylosidase
VNEAYSYWTFGDVFEEQGVPTSLFHGGFGMVAAGNIPKPTFWTFYFFKQLKMFSQDCVFRNDNSVVVKRDDEYAGILWNFEDCDKDIEYVFNLSEGGEYSLVTKTVDEVCCNPLKLWHDIGEPAYPSKEETELIKSAAYPQVGSCIVKPESAQTPLMLNVRKNGVVYLTLTKRHGNPDRGYDYEKVLSFH